MLRFRVKSEIKIASDTFGHIVRLCGFLRIMFDFHRTLRIYANKNIRAACSPVDAEPRKLLVAEDR